jgi:hypothetical protein
MPSMPEATGLWAGLQEMIRRAKMPGKRTEYLMIEQRFILSQM